MSASRYDYKKLLAAVADPTVAAIRLTVDLSPAADEEGGNKTRVFPPTYAPKKKTGEKKPPPEYVISDSADDAGKIAVLDSVQSQANRLEAVLQEACDNGDLDLPLLAVDFGDLPREPRKLTVLQMPHRWADAILRDSVDGVDGVDGVGEKKSKKKNKAFLKTDIGKALAESNLRNATAVFGYCPSSLLFGVWHSTGKGGGRGVKYPRALASEIIAYGAKEATHSAVRDDPLGIEIEPFQELYKNDPSFKKWVDEKTGDKDEKIGDKKEDKGKPSSINHGNILASGGLGGITFRAAKLTAVITLAGMRRLRFPVDGAFDKDRDYAARAVLAAMGLFALARQNESGYDLRSRCWLRALSAPRFQFVRNAAGDERFGLDAQSAGETLAQAIEEAQKLGLPWNAGEMLFHPNAQMKKILAKQAESEKNDAGD